MSSGSLQSPLLFLPFELRERIYRQLLVAEPRGYLTLYHDRHGRDTSFHIDTAILGTNKQIYSECLPILYGLNTFRIDVSTGVVVQCTGGYYPDSITDPEPLLRDDKQVHHTIPRRRRPVYDISERARFPHGVVYPECFQRLRHIEMATSPSAVWASAMGGNFFSFIGDLMIKLLEVLAADQGDTRSSRKTLKLFVEPSWRDGSLFGTQKRVRRLVRNKRRHDVGDIIKGLKAVSKVRKVEVIQNGEFVDLTKLDSK